MIEASRTPYQAGAGVLTGIAGLATGQATAWALKSAGGPIDAVAAMVDDWTSGALGRRVFGDPSGPVAEIVVVVLLVALCAWLGSQFIKRPFLPGICYLVVGLIGFGAILRYGESEVESSMGMAVGMVTWVVVTRVFTAPLAELEVGDPGQGRRQFLVRFGAVAVLTAAGSIVGILPKRKLEKVEAERALLRLPITRGVVPAGADFEIEGISDWGTSVENFYEYKTGSVSVIPWSEWRLRIHGLVDRELTLTYEDLVNRMGRKATEAWITLVGVTNEVGGPRVGNAFWSGVLFRDLLAEVGVKDSADCVLQTAQDGWTAATPLSVLTDNRNAMLAVAMNGEPIELGHGFPVRSIVPGLYGYVSATKWLVDLEVTRFEEVESDGVKDGFAERGPILTQSRIDTPDADEKVDAGQVRVGGVAWAPHTGIRSVEYQIDGSAWLAAELGAAVKPYDSWVQWTAMLDLEPGKHVLVVRATDRSGKVQDDTRTDPKPNGATGLHQVKFTAV